MSDTKNKSLTVFKSDRHEDIAAILLAGVIVAFVLVYMAFIATSVSIKADSDGKLHSIAVAAGQEVQKGDLLYTLIVTEKKWSGKEVAVTEREKPVKAKANGKVVEILASAGVATKRGQTPIFVLAHQRGTLP